MERNRNTDLFQKIKEGNENAFNEAFNTYYPRLCYFADKFLQDWDESQSLVQQVFVDLWMKREKLQVNYQLQAYLFQSVQHASLDYLKHRKIEVKYKKRLLSMPADVDQDLYGEAELNARINECVQRLPDKCRTIFLLSRMEKKKYAEIASLLNISVKTVEMQMGIALKKMRAGLSEFTFIQMISFFSRKE